MYRVRVGQEFLGRHRVGDRLRPVGEVHAYEFEHRQEAELHARLWVEDVKPDAEVVVEEVA